MSWRVSDVTKAFQVTGSDGETATITIRRMSEGDSLRMQQITAEALAAGKSYSQVLVELRRYRIATFITAWTLPFDLSPDAVEELSPEVASAVDEEVQLFNPGVFPRAQSIEDRAQAAKALAEILAAFLGEEDDSITQDDLAAALATYQGDDVARPTESA